MNNFTLCADDFGQNPEISQGILTLIANNRLTATSCMTTAKDWLVFAKELIPYQQQIDVGLHFNLTHGKALSDPRWQFSSLNHLIFQSLFKQLDIKKIILELKTQINCFSQAMGKLPDFIDGHQHVHQFPIIREALIETLSTFDKKPYVRITANSWQDSLLNLNDFPKAQIIHLMGAIQLADLCQHHQIPFNQSFSGIYRFGSLKNYRTVFRGFLKNLNPRQLIMCHPGLTSDDPSDKIREVRPKELNYFLSDDFLQDCQEFQAKLSKF